MLPGEKTPQDCKRRNPHIWPVAPPVLACDQAFERFLNLLIRFATIICHQPRIGPQPWNVGKKGVGRVSVSAY
jgi:hypothetical protein